MLNKRHDETTCYIEVNGGLCIKYRQSRSCCPHYGELGPFILLRFAHNKKSSDLWSICAVNSRHILCDENILIILFLSHMPLFDRFWSVCKCGISTSTTISVAVGLFYWNVKRIQATCVNGKIMEKMAIKWHRPKHQGDRWKGPDFIGLIFTFILCSLTIFFAVDYGIYFCAWQKKH